MTARSFTDRSFAQGLPDPALRGDFYAGVRTKRLVAWVLDTILIALVSAILVPFTAFTALFFFPVFMLVIGFFYRWFSLSAGSATWGMALMAIQLRESDGHKLSSSTAFWHTVGYSVSIAMAPLQLISVIMMCVTDRRQGLTDLILNTAAINRPRW
jgi:uncharacterized RDD family membrane protein YckC